MASRRIPLTQLTHITPSELTLLRRVRWVVRTELLAEVLMRRGIPPRPIRAQGASMMPRFLRLLHLGLGQVIPGGKVWAHPLRIWDRRPPSMEIL